VRARAGCGDPTRSVRYVLGRRRRRRLLGLAEEKVPYRESEADDAGRGDGDFLEQVRPVRGLREHEFCESHFVIRSSGIFVRIRGCGGVRHAWTSSTTGVSTTGISEARARTGATSCAAGVGATDNGTAVASAAPRPTCSAPRPTS